MGSNTALQAELTSAQTMMRDWAESRRTPFGTRVPKIALPVAAFGFIQVPAFGTQANILPASVPANQDYIYKVKPNWYALICGLILQFTGTGSAPNPGDLSYTIDVDRPLGVSGVGYTEKDYNAVPFLLGSFTLGFPWPTEFKHKNGEELRIKATAIANMGTGAGNFFQAALLGWEWPERGWE
jgi:hypothetical protein